MTRLGYSVLRMEHFGSATVERASARVVQQIRDSGVTLTWLCEKTGIPRSTMNRRVANPADFTVNELERVASALRIDVAALFGAAA